MKTRVNRLIASLFALVLCVSLVFSQGVNAKAAEKGETEGSGVLELNVFNAEEYISEEDEDWGTYDIIAKFEEAATKRLVHKLTHFINELAYLLHSYYNDEKIITEDEELTREKLTIITAIQTVLVDALNLIGVSAPEKM